MNTRAAVLERGKRLTGKPRRITIEIDVEIDRAFENAEQERYVLSTIEDALEPDVWFTTLANEDSAPQRFTKARARLRK